MEGQRMTRAKVAVWLFAAVSVLSFIAALIPVLKGEQANAVFLGTVIKFEATDQPYSPSRSVPSSNKSMMAMFRVHTVWKGPTQPLLNVTTGFGGGDCGIDFVVGRTYLVYAYRLRDGTLSAGVCSRTTSAPGHDLKSLGPGTPAKEADVSPQPP
jgi:hypothetical protein